MENVLGILILAAVLTILVGTSNGKDIESRPNWSQEMAGYRAARDAADAKAMAKARAEAVAKKAKAAAAASGPKLVISAKTPATEMIHVVAKAFVVPAGCIYGICKKESDCLLADYSANWPLAKDLLNGACVKEAKKSPAWCQAQWNALKEVCGQTRKDGSSVCDPNTVRTSVAYAMGVTQNLPTTVLRKKRIDPRVDCDGDGVVDPHSLADALCLTASHVRASYDNRPATVKEGEAGWIWAANAYFGSQDSGYFAGKNVKRKKKGKTVLVRSRGVGEHWKDWCAAQGCDSVRTLLASN